MNNKKNIIQLLIIFLIVVDIFSCSSKPEPKLELFSPEAFAFDIGDSWEVNASVNAKGFEQIENNDKWKVKLSFSVNLIMADSIIYNNIFNDLIFEEKNNEFEEVQLEAQIEIDSSFADGDYKLVFNVTDEFSNQTKVINIDFNLTK